MGTSGSNFGSSGSNPLIPTWLDDPSQEMQGTSVEGTTEGNSEEVRSEPIPPATQVDPQRYSAARGNFTRYVHSGGRNTQSLRRAVSNYVRKSSGGSRNATKKMSSSRRTASKLLGFLQEASTSGIESALKTINLNNLSGRPIDELFIELTDFLCPSGGSVDAGIAREAFIKALTEAIDEGVIAEDSSLNAEQVEVIFEEYITNSIEIKLLNEIGTNTFFQTQTLDDAENIEDQLHDFIKNSVSDAVSNAESKIEKLQQSEVSTFVDSIYEKTFDLLASLYQEGEV